jgi:hypothetical protein
MTLWSEPRFRVGAQGYFYAGKQAARIVEPTATSDPSPSATLTAVGPCAVPGWSQNDNMRGVTGAGSGRDLAAVPGRRECSMQTRIDVADPTFLTGGNFVRDHANPGAAGTELGLNLMLLEIGVPTVYGADSFAIRGVDALANSLRLEMSEGQNLVAQVEFWPICFMAAGAAATAPPPTNSVPAIWQTFSLLHGGIDYHPGLAGVTLTINNQLERSNSRKLMTSGGNELAISRTPYLIKPKVEQVSVSYRWHTIPPPALWSVFNVGAVQFVAEQPGTGAGRKRLRVTIDNNYMNNVTGQEAQANAMFTASGEMIANAITMAVESVS